MKNIIHNNVGELINRGFKENLEKIITNRQLIKEIISNEKKYEKTDTILNHIIPANYFLSWNNNKNKKRHHKLNFYKIDSEEKLIKSAENFLAIKYLFSPKIEKSFTNINIDDYKLNSERNYWIEKLEKSMYDQHIKPFGMIHINTKNKLKFCLFENEDREDKNFNYHKKASINNEIIRKITGFNIFKGQISLFKARQFIASYFLLNEKENMKSHNFTINVLINLIYLLEENKKEIIYFEEIIKTIVRKIVYLSVCENLKDENNQIFIEFNDEFDKSLKQDVDIEKNKPLIINFLKTLIEEINHNNKENSDFCIEINSLFLINLRSFYMKEDEDKEYIIYLSKDPIVINSLPMIEEIHDEMYMGFLPLSPHILIMELYKDGLEEFYEFMKENMLKNKEKREEVHNIILNSYYRILHNKTKDKNHNCWLLKKQK